MHHYKIEIAMLDQSLLELLVIQHERNVIQHDQ